MRVAASDDLLKGGDESGSDVFLGGGGRRGGADVVYAFEDHGVGDGGVREDVAIDAAESIRSKAVVEDAVSARCLVEDCDAAGGVFLLHACEDEIWPSETKFR